MTLGIRLFLGRSRSIALLVHKMHKRIPVQALIVATVMTLIVLGSAPGGGVLVVFGSLLLFVGIFMRLTRWIESAANAVAMLFIGYFFYLLLLGSGLLLFGSGPAKFTSCVGYLILTSLLTLIYLWVPLGLGLLFGGLAIRVGHRLSTESEYPAQQGGADQSATAPESKSEGIEKPKPESETAPR